MIPPDYSVYFTTMATVGATLFGLIFVAISIAPERVAVTSAPLERRIKAFAANNALLNPLIILGGFFLYGFETYFAVRLIQSPAGSFALYAFSNFLIIIMIYGVIRVWELVGIRQFHVKDWLSSFQTAKKKEIIPGPNSAEAETVTKKRGVEYYR
jgi:hypothetical protein